MPASAVFDWVSQELERRTELSRLEARGTVRLVLKSAGLDPASVSTHQMVVVLQRLMPAALAKRRVDDAESFCRLLAEDLRLFASTEPHEKQDTAYDVFERLDSRAKPGPKR